MWRPIVVLFLILTSLSSFSQKEANIWYFGFEAGIDFNTDVPNSLNDGMMWTSEGCSSISDKNGELLFYTHGNTIWNKNHEIMPNGDALLGIPSATQSSIIIRKPESTNTYYIFTVDGQENKFSSGLRYSEVNMTLDDGLGDLTENRNVQLIQPTCEKLTAVMHSNCKDIWVITHGWGNNNFYAYLVTSSGVNTMPVISSTGMVVDGFIGVGMGDDFTRGVGQLKTSPNGKFIAMVNYSMGNGLIGDFNNTTGTVSNPTTLNLSSGSYGLEFSPSSKLLYVTLFNGESSLLQFNLFAPNIPSSQITLKTSGQMTSLQLGPDKKIYGLVTLKDRSLAVINIPDTIGVGCNFVEEAVSLGQKRHGWGLPNFMTSLFSAPKLDMDTMKITGFYLPNAITPNGDGINDILFSLTEKQITEFEFLVFDRWGELIYRTTDIEQGWNAKKNGNIVPSGIYTIKIRFKEAEETSELMRKVTVIR